MKRARKIGFIIAILPLILALSGCGILSDYVESSVQEAAETEVQASEEYQLYEEYRASGALNESGVFSLPDQSEIDEGSNGSQGVLVTIATNPFLSCVYYTNEETKSPIVPRGVYLSPGESLYVDSVAVNNDISNLYGFSGFRIWSYDQDGNRGSEPYDEVGIESGLLLTVPDDYAGTGFAIEPLGLYSDRHITAGAYYLKNDIEEPLSSGQWAVNGKPFTGSVDISPVESYTVSYDYSAYADDYYFVDSHPECWYSDEDENKVIFSEVSAEGQETEFSVEMHPYITMSVTNSHLKITAGLPFIGDHGEGIIESITKNTYPIEQEYVGESSFDIPKLKVGDTIVVRVGKEYAITGTGVSVGSPSPLGSNGENGYEYTVVIPETSERIGIDVTVRSSNAEGLFEGYNAANADVSVTRANGTVLEVGQELPGDDERITLVIVPHDGYYIDGFTEKEDYSFVKKMKFSDLEEDISSILSDHPANRFLRLSLVLSDEAGTYTYKLDGEPVEGSELLNVRVGQDLKVVYKTNDDYKIVRRLIGGNSASGSVEITADMDGATIDRYTFGFAVEKKVE